MQRYPIRRSVLLYATAMAAAMACSQRDVSYRTRAYSLAAPALRAERADGVRPEASEAAGEPGTPPATVAPGNGSGGTGVDRLHSAALAADSSASIIPTLLIRTGQASIEVVSVDDGIARVRQLAQRVGGYIANSSMQGGKQTVRSATLSMKIPAARFDQVVAGLQPIGTVDAVSVTAEDVGEEFVDVNARLANDRRLEQRLIELLAQRTGKLSDVLAVETELARVREEIERYEGRIRYLRSQAAVSTLIITVHEHAPILDESIGRNPIVDAGKTAWRNFVAFVAGVIASSGILIPLGVLAYLGWTLYRRGQRKI